MDSQSNNDQQKHDTAIKPVVLSKDEALYPPSKKAMTIAAVVGVLAIIALIVSFVLFPI